MSLPKLSALIAALVEVRAELRQQRASAQELATATMRIVRHYWEPYVKPQNQWPIYDTFPKCVYCDGTGLVMHRGVTNRLGIVVDEGSPCKCPLGARFIPPMKTDADYTQAGKTPKVQKTWARAGR